MCMCIKCIPPPPPHSNSRLHSRSLRLRRMPAGGGGGDSDGRGSHNRVYLSTSIISVPRNNVARWNRKLPTVSRRRRRLASVFTCFYLPPPPYSIAFSSVNCREQMPLRTLLLLSFLFLCFYSSFRIPLCACAPCTRDGDGGVQVSGHRDRPAAVGGGNVATTARASPSTYPYT